MALLAKGWCSSKNRNHNKFIHEFSQSGFLKKTRIKLLLKNERFSENVSFDKVIIVYGKIRNFISRSEFIKFRCSSKLFKTSLYFKKMLINCVNLVLIEENYVDNVEISVVLTNDDKICRYNKEFRNIDKPTDVLSFPMMDKHPVTGDLVLGDIVINIDAANRQSIEYGHSLEREIAFLTIHSLFHLFGYDHKNTLEENVMRSKQRRILDRMGLKVKNEKRNSCKIEKYV